LYTEAVWAGLEAAIAAKRVPAAPAQMLNATTYQTQARVRLATCTPLPVGWTAAKPTRISAWYDSLMSRWLDESVLGRCAAGATPPAAWDLHFRGSTVVLFGESTLTSGRLRVSLDGATPSVLDCRSGAGGTFRLDATLATGLDPSVDHTIRLEPFDDRAGPAEWRLESLCVAGGDAHVWR
jgi:hypothetical protein